MKNNKAEYSSKCKKMKSLLATINTALIIVFTSCITTDEQFDESVWRSTVSKVDQSLIYAPHYNDGVYFNPWLRQDDRGFATFLKWRLFGEKGKYTEEEEEYLPEVIPDALKRIKEMKNSDFILWVGHATFLIRIKGEYWITDPVFSRRIILPVRKTPPAITAKDLIGLEGRLNVVISHNHYDHLDEESIRSMPDGTRFFVPRGLASLIRDFGGKEVVEMDWWEESVSLNGTRIVCLPMQHWSRRITQARNSTLWASYMIITDNKKIYFAGDSGYFNGYVEIGKRFPGIDYVLMPTTAYRPRWFMHYAHMDVREAIDAFTDLGARYFIPTQWGTFKLGDEPPGYPALDLIREIKKQKLDPERFIILNIGGIVSMDNSR